MATGLPSVAVSDLFEEPSGEAIKRFAHGSMAGGAGQSQQRPGYEPLQLSSVGSLGLAYQVAPHMVLVLVVQPVQSLTATTGLVVVTSQ